MPPQSLYPKRNQTQNEFMKSLFSLLLTLISIGIYPNPQITKHIVRHKGDYWYDTLVNYRLGMVEIDTNSFFYNGIKNNIDKLVGDKYSEAFLWLIACSGDTVISAIETSEFKTKPDYPLFDYYVGVINYTCASGQKYFILTSDFSEEANEFITNNFKVSTDSFDIKYDVRFVPDSIWILYPDTYTRYDCMILDTTIQNLRFTLVNNIIIPEGTEERNLNFLYRRVPRKPE